MRLLTLTLFLIQRLSLSLISAQKLETLEFSKKNELICGEGLADCEISQGSSCIFHDSSVYVSSLVADALLCHSNKGWLPCLRIQINITTEGSHEYSGVSWGATQEEQDETKEEEIGSSEEHLTAASASVSIEVCYSAPDFSSSKKITFTPHISPDNKTQMWMILIILLKDHFGSPFTIFSKATLNHNFSHITMPTVDTVCSQGLDIPMCDGPCLNPETNHTSGMIKLHVDAAGRDLKDLQACQKMEKEMECSKLDLTNNSLMIPMSSVAPCLCFQVWWKTGNRPRKECCPFLNDTVLSGSNVSVSVVEQSETRDGVLYKNSTALVWYITAPCRLEAELYLCKKTWSGTGCHEVHDLMKTKLHIHSHHPKWKNNIKRHWQAQGEFVEVERHPSLCVQIKVKGMEGLFQPVCPFEVARTHWSLFLLVSVVLVCLTVLGAYAAQGTLKGWVFKWLKVDDIRGAVGGSQVVLLYPPDADSGLAELVCRLGSGLSSLGFNVSLDLWSRSELSVLGPVPWLHSRLDRVQRHGGKVVLVLTQAAWARVDEWGCHARAKNREEQKEDEEEEDSSHFASTSTCSDVFSASLSCILADYLQGRAGERFVLAQFETQPAGPPGAGGPMPELFRGLSLFSLPSQSLGFLTELANGTHRRQADRGSNRRMRAGGLRAGSKALTEALRELRGGTGYRFAGLSQGFKTEDPWESIPLQQGLSSPTASPDLHSKSNTVNWV